ncbi:MAG: phosphopantetheine-binding protein [Pseudomonadota bacterium]|jgi:aryl carrier-like protein
MPTLDVAPAPEARHSPSRDYAHIEAHLCACPGIEDAFVTAHSDRQASCLVAYLVAKDGAVPGLGAIHARLSGLLPVGLLPTTFIALERLPRRSDGRLDLAALPLPGSATLGQRQYEVPQGRTETAIAALWQDLLGLEQVGRQAHFFELGGNSALAVQLVHRLRRECRVEVSMRDLFTHPVLHQFALALRTVGAPSRPMQDALVPEFA